MNFAICRLSVNGPPAGVGEAGRADGDQRIGCFPPKRLVLKVVNGPPTRPFSPMLSKRVFIKVCQPDDVLVDPAQNRKAAVCGFAYS